MAFRRLGFAIAAGAVLALALPAFAQASAEKPAAPPPYEALVKNGSFADGLKAADEALAKTPADADASYWKIRALLGLGRYKEAAVIAVPLAAKHPDRPEFRYLAGRCAFEMGMYAQAIQMWSALYGNKEWSEAAYRSSANAFMAQGKRAQAASLLSEAIPKFEKPPKDLLELSLEADDDVARSLKTLDALIQANPQEKEDYEAQKKLYLAAGSGRLFDEKPEPSYPLTIPLKEKSEFRDISGLTWGGDSTTSVTSSSKVVVPASVNGSKDKWMLLDSGSSVVLVSPYFVKELGIEPVSTARYMGMGYKGEQNTSWVLLKTLKVGDLTLSNVPAMVIGKDAEFFKEVGGILPLSLFRRHAALYDRRRSKFVLNAPGTPPASVMGSGTFAVKSLWLSGKPFVETTIQGKPGLFCLVDTGAYTTFIAWDKLDALGIRIKSTLGASTGSGLSGAFHAGVADNVTVLLGTAQFNMPTVQVTDIGGGYGVDCYGILGRNVLDLFQAFFDPSNNVVAFCPYDKGR